MLENNIAVRFLEITLDQQIFRIFTQSNDHIYTWSVQGRIAGFEIHTKFPEHHDRPHHGER